MANKFILMSILMDDDFGLVLADEYLRSKKVKLDKELKFSLENYDEASCKLDFRFSKQDIFRLARALKIPTTMRTNTRKVFRGIDGLCILLRRLAYPNRLCELQKSFGYSPPDLSKIINCMLDYIYENYHERLTSLDQWWLSIDNLKKYALAIKNKGSPLPGCFGFIDGTLHRTCRPKQHQREMYSGHKRTHALKYQSVVLPNGIIANLYGGVPGRRHDAFMLAKSNLVENLLQHLQGEPLYLYGDSGYPLKRCLITPHIGNNLTPEQKAFNESMSKVRISVEWEFGELFDQFAFLSYKKNQKLYLQPLEKYVKVAAILKNCQTCLYGCQTSTYFNLSPMSLEEYLSNNINMCQA